jgi:hypothetical protein
MVGTFYFLPALSAVGPSVAFKQPDGKAHGLKVTKLPAQLHRPSVSSRSHTRTATAVSHTGYRRAVYEQAGP